MSGFIFANKTDTTRSASNIDCIHLVRDAGEFAYVIAPQTAFEQPDRLLSMPTKAAYGLSSSMRLALQLAHGKTVGERGAVPIGRVKRTYANDVDVMYLDDFDDLVQSL